MDDYVELKVGAHTYHHFAVSHISHIEVCRGEVLIVDKNGSKNKLIDHPQIILGRLRRAGFFNQ